MTFCMVDLVMKLSYLKKAWCSIHDFHASLQATFDGIKNMMESSKCCPWVCGNVCVNITLQVNMLAYHNGEHFEYELLVLVVDRSYPNPIYAQEKIEAMLPPLKITPHTHAPHTCAHTYTHTMGNDWAWSGEAFLHKRLIYHNHSLPVEFQCCHDPERGGGMMKTCSMLAQIYNALQKHCGNPVRRVWSDWQVPKSSCHIQQVTDPYITWTRLTQSMII